MHRTTARSSIAHRFAPYILAVATVTLGCEPGQQLPLPVASDLEAPDELLFAGTDLVLGADWAESRILAAPAGATRIGLLLDVNDAALLSSVVNEIQVRGFDRLGDPQPWLPAQATFVEDRYLVARADPGTTVFGAQLRLPARRALSIEHIAFAAVVPEESPDAVVVAEGLGQRDGALSVAGLVVPRSAWNARPTKCTSKDGKKSRMAIHHTFTPPGTGGSIEARVRSIQAYHMDTRGWCDVGYHYLVGDDGRIFEGRPAAYIGAHVSNHNTGNIGVSFVGCFQTGECDSIGAMTPSTAALNATRNLLAALSDQHGIPLSTSAVKGHMQHSGASTSCPGDRLLGRIPELLSGAAEPPNPPVAGGPGRVLGVVFDASVTADPAEAGNKRIKNAIVSASDGSTAAVKGDEALFELELAPGTWTLVATAPGYAPSSRIVTVTGPGETWASLGLSPTGAPAGNNEAVLTITTTAGAPVADAVVVVGSAWHRAAGGTLTVAVAAPTSATVHAPSMSSKSVQLKPGSTSAVALANEPGTGGGTFQGVVWDAGKTSSPDAVGAVRLSDALVVCSCGRTRRARLGDAYWSFVAPAGSHTFTAVAAGYAPGAVTGTVGAGGSEWGSIGLTKNGQAPVVPPTNPTTTATVCYPGAAGAGDACVAAWPAANVADPAYVYPKPLSSQYAPPTRYVDLEAALGSLKLAKNFALKEFMSPAKGRWGVLAPKMVAHWQAIRTKLGVPLVVNSGYRSPGWNDGIDGSAQNSRHMWGDAADVTPGGGVSLSTLAAACKNEGADFVQIYTSHVHCDWRDEALEPGFFGAANKPGALSPHPHTARARAAATARVHGVAFELIAGAAGAGEPLAVSLGEVVYLEASHEGFDEGKPWVRWEIEGPDGARVAEPASFAAFEMRSPGPYSVRWSVGGQLEGSFALVVP